METVQTFVHAVRRSQLLPASQLTELKNKLLAEPRGVRDLAGQLVQRGWLTSYQAEQIMLGNEQELVVGPYRVLALAGEGGLCQVYRAWDTLQHREVALKVVHADLRDKPDVCEQLQNEAKVLAQLSHPNFIKALKDGHGPTPYSFVMEFVDGIDLARLLKASGPLPVPQACLVARQTAMGLQYAFEQGLVHRDIKPANLLIAYRGDRVWILDIGLARLEWSYRDLSSSLTPTSQGSAIMGTPDYIAPEQAMNPDGANIRADIYSLGCTFFHLLTGQPPFPGRSLTQKLLHHQQSPPPSAKALRPEVPADLAALVQKMMAKAPEERFQTPAGVAVALRRFCTGDPGRWPLERYREKRGDLGSPLLATTRDENATMPLTPPILTLTPVPGDTLSLQPTEGPPAPPQRVEHRVTVRRAGNPVPVLISDARAETEPMHGWVLDRSQTGLGLLVDEPVQAGAVVCVRSDRPGASLPRWIPVRVVYCVTERSSWKVGCSFVHNLSGEEMRWFG